MKRTYHILVVLLLLCIFSGGVQAAYLDAYDANLKLLMHNNESTMQDSKGHVVTVTNVTANTTSKQLGAASAWFTGVKSNLTMAYSSDFHAASNNLTILGWYQFENPGTTRYMFGHGTITGSDTELFGSIGTNNKPSCYFRDDAAATKTVTANDAITDSNFHQIVCEKANDSFDMYVDGVKQTTTTLTSVASATSAAPFAVGGFGAYSQNNFAGNIDEFAMWIGVAIPIEELYPQIYEVDEATTAPVSSFTPVTSSGVSPHSVAFTDTSTNTPTEWNWTVEGKIGNTTKYLNVSTSQNPTFSFLEGNYTISLGAGNADGFDMSDQNSWVNVSFGGPVVSFSTNVTSGVAPMALYLNDTSTRSPTAWNTSWGDNTWTNQTSFPATNITHIYSTSGSYYINQYATNPYGTANGTPLLITVYGPAYSQFSAWNTAGNAPHTTYLYDTSTNLTPGPATHYWDFGDGNTSTSQNTYYTWNITGTYTVKHSVDNGVSVNWSNQTNYVTVGTGVTAPVASFYGGPQLGAPPLQVFFTDVSTNTPTSWLWDFGDGNTTSNTSQNPTHLYTRSGFFTVNLTATNGAGSNSSVQSNFVMVY